MALSNPYADLERRDLHLTEWRFHIYSKENGVSPDRVAIPHLLQGKRRPETPVKI
jgi:hypothetical protein